MAYAGSASSSFAKWYVAKLKAYPLITNMSSAFLLMTTGDVLAQELEVSGCSDARSVSSSHQQQLPSSQPSAVALKSAISTPMLTSANATATTLANETRGTTAHGLIAALEHRANGWSASKLADAVEEEFRFWNPFRTGTMVAWSVGVYTPFYLAVYRLYDQYLPKKTPTGIASRVGLSFLLSIPINAAFYMYGAAINHTTEWLAIRQEWRHELADMGLAFESADHVVDLPLDWEALRAKCQLKIDNELERTVRSTTSWNAP